MAAISFMLPLYRVSKSGNKIYHIIGISHENFPNLHLAEYEQEKKICIIKIHVIFLRVDFFMNINRSAIVPSTLNSSTSTDGFMF